MNRRTTLKRLFRARQLSDGSTVAWWTQVGLVVAVVVVVAILLPSIAPPGKPAGALGNALDIVDFERTFGLFFEHTIQRAALEFTPIVIAANWWYCVMHFVVTAAVFGWLFRRYTDDFPRWRNTFAVSSVVTLAIQAVWPLTPQRLLHGAGHTPHFVDALSTFSSPWSFSSSGGVANQYAAMPSMHVVWAVICACVLVPRVKRRWVQVCAVIYPAITVLAIMITGNHYFVDALGAIPIVVLGYVLARTFTRKGRHPHGAEPAPRTDPGDTGLGPDSREGELVPQR